MSDTLKVFGTTYTDVAGFKAKSGETFLSYIRPSGTLTVTANDTYDVTDKASVVVNVQPTLQPKAVTPSNTQKIITADEVYWNDIAYFSNVSLTPNVEYPFGITLEVGREYYIYGEGADEFETTFVFTGSPQSIETDRGYTGVIGSTGITMSQDSTDFADMIIEVKTTPYGLSSVTVNAIPSNYVGSAITRDPTPTASGKTVTIPSGYYSAQKTQDVTEVTQATPSISVDASGLITASATQAAGYVAAGTKSATQQLSTQSAVTITPTSASQQAVASGKYTTGAITVEAIPSEYVVPSGSTTITTNGTYSVTNLSEAVVNVPGNQISEIKTIVQNSRSSGTFTVLRITYNNYSSGTSGIGCISNNIANGSSNTNSHTALFNGTQVIMHVAFAVKSITYNGEEANYTKYGSSAQWDIHLTIPENYNDTIPFVFS